MPQAVPPSNRQARTRACFAPHGSRSLPERPSPALQAPSRRGAYGVERRQGVLGGLAPCRRHHRGDRSGDLLRESRDPHRRDRCPLRQPADDHAHRSPRAHPLPEIGPTRLQAVGDKGSGAGRTRKGAGSDRPDRSRHAARHRPGAVRTVSPAGHKRDPGRAGDRVATLLRVVGGRDPRSDGLAPGTPRPVDGRHGRHTSSTRPRRDARTPATTCCRSSRPSPSTATS